MPSSDLHRRADGGLAINSAGIPLNLKIRPLLSKADIEAHFSKYGNGKITEVKLMNGFGFIEYEDPLDARDVVPAFHGTDFMGERLTVQFARGNRHREGFSGHERAPPRPRRTPHRMQITGLPNDTSWQDLKDFARQSNLDVVYSETGRDGTGRGFVEFETAADLKTAVDKLDGREFKGNAVSCISDIHLPENVLGPGPLGDVPICTRRTIMIVGALLEDTVLAVRAIEMAIGREAPVDDHPHLTTTMIVAEAIGLHHAALLTITRRAAATTILIVVTIPYLQTPTQTVGRTIDLLGTSPLVTGAILGMVMDQETTTGADTGKSNPLPLSELSLDENIRSTLCEFTRPR
ncbi:hypothetical protein SAPIO_CDS5458 [Scedosporium apiospermum]|uniref:RRM domain-containing protein n=1 Tax=Pseudallescheria apiosperma TaxID=563466 RepID=A0A084G6N8_PSEDA|nr:uncharacterized protein SAPIO_CDS5458 [Scedosporium apiospermum]KEZ43000.1 hypothetical protein SAPIO_CDS5458 [Scedosporium apiospermum]